MASEQTVARIKEMLIRRLRLKLTADEIKTDDLLFDPGDGSGQDLPGPDSLGLDSLGLDSLGLDSLGLDSIDALELVVALQKEFNCVIADKAAAEKVLVSVSTIADFVEAQGKTTP